MAIAATRGWPRGRWERSATDVWPPPALELLRSCSTKQAMFIERTPDTFLVYAEGARNKLAVVNRRAIEQYDKVVSLWDAERIFYRKMLNKNSNKSRA